MKSIEVNGELYCKIFVDNDFVLMDFIDLIINFTGGIKEYSNSVYNEFLDIEISKNDEYDEAMKHKANGFLSFPYYLEVNALLYVDYDVYVQQLKSLIKFLRSKGMRVIPSCDFEDELNDGKSYTEFMK